jgi:signal transduction histidine kinase
MPRPRPLWILAAVIIVLGSIATNEPTSPGRSVITTLTCLAAAFGVLVAWWRPRSSVLVTGTAMAVYFAADLRHGPSFLALPLVALAASQRSPRARLTPSLAIAMGLVMGGMAASAGLHGFLWSDTLWEATAQLALVAGTAFAGWSLADRRETRQAQARRTISEERLRMARDLHDSVGHGLAVISMHAGVGLRMLDRDTEAVRGNLEAIRQASQESLESLRSEVARLSGNSVPRRVASGAADLPALLDRVRGGGLQVTFEGDDSGLPEPTEQMLYAVIQESLTNVLRHAHATRATITLHRFDRRLRLTIADDGIGAPPDSVDGMGLSGMKTRVEALGGTFNAANGATGGFVVRAEVPT